jgi:Tfp pilus assembly protein PilF
LLTGLTAVREIWLERDFWVRDVVADYLYFCGERARFRRTGKEKDYYEKASSIGHDSKFNHLRLAMAYLEAGDTAGAEGECKKALTLDPHFIPANFTLGEIYLAQQKFAKAKNELAKAIKKKPYQAGAHHNLGLALMELGEPVQAKKEAELAIKLDSGLWYPYVLMANILEREGNFEKAKAYRDKAKQLRGHNT